MPARRGHTLAALAVVALAAADPALAACEAEWIDITRIDTHDGLRLRAVNQTPYPLTYTLNVRLYGMQVDGPRRVTETLPPHGHKSDIRLRHDDPGERGRYRYRCQWTVGDMDAQHDESKLYLLPYAPGRSYRVLQGFGSSFSHTGREQYAVDFKMPEGTPVHAARDGVVARIEEAHDIGCWRDGCGRYANYIVVLHNDGTTGEYYHLQKDGALVEVGDAVARGQKIGLSGNTGHTTMPHLHFAVYRATEWGNTQSIPVRFASADGIIDRPRRGGRYTAAPLASGLRMSRDDGESRPTPSAN